MQSKGGRDINLGMGREGCRQTTIWIDDKLGDDWIVEERLDQEESGLNTTETVLDCHPQDRWEHSFSLIVI